MQSQLAPPVLERRSFGTSFLTVLLLRSCGTSHLAQHHDVVIIDNLATGRGVNIEHLIQRYPST
ncbi:MAG: hypothetical protein LLF90_07145 [Methanomicrobiaceae archaeon]|nr:hypothetical protein [Methanomicrobiaceae archaeon]